MEKQYKEIHITTTDDEIVKGENRNDWNYQLRDEIISAIETQEAPPLNNN